MSDSLDRVTPNLHTKLVNAPSDLDGLPRRLVATILEALSQMTSQESPSEHAIHDAIRQIAEGSSATCGWLMTTRNGTNAPRVVCSHNLDPLVQGDSAQLALLSLPELGRPADPFVHHCPPSTAAGHAPGLGARFLLCLPIVDNDLLEGVLALGFNEEPLWHSKEKETLRLLSQGILCFLRLIRIQETKDDFRARAAVLAFVARALSQETDVERVLGFGLEYSVSFLNLVRADVWLKSENGSVLTLASSMTLGLAPPSSDPIELGKGIIGKFADGAIPMQETGPSGGPLDPQGIEGPSSNGVSSIAAVPLIHCGEVLGVLAAYDRPGRVFGDLDIAFLRSVASLCASSMVNARLSQNLQMAAMRQETLLAMSRDVAAGLDLSSTLGRCVRWASRLVEAELAAIWLIVESEESLDMAACLGGDPGRVGVTRIPKDGSLLWKAASTVTPVVAECSRQGNQIDSQWIVEKGIEPYQLMILPLRHRGRTIGVLSLVNKVGGPFVETDVKLLSLASEMIALAVGNAKSHAKVLRLGEEREKLYRQALQSARLATIGRLTASLAHEIKNPMQAIEGALVLCTERYGDPIALAELVGLSLKESERVVRLVDRMQSIYTPTADHGRPLPLNEALQEAVEVARKELSRLGITFEVELEPNSTEVKGEADQLRLVLLSLMISLGDAMARAGARELKIAVRASAGRGVVAFRCTEPVAEWMDMLDDEGGEPVTGAAFSLWFVKEVLRTLGGRTTSTRTQAGSEVTVELPVKEAPSRGQPVGTGEEL